VPPNFNLRDSRTELYFLIIELSVPHRDLLESFEQFLKEKEAKKDEEQKKAEEEK